MQAIVKLYFIWALVYMTNNTFLTDIMTEKQPSKGGPVLRARDRPCKIDRAEQP